MLSWQQICHWRPNYRRILKIVLLDKKHIASSIYAWNNKQAKCVSSLSMSDINLLSLPRVGHIGFLIILFAIDHLQTSLYMVTEFCLNRSGCSPVKDTRIFVAIIKIKKIPPKTIVTQLTVVWLNIRERIWSHTTAILYLHIHSFQNSIYLWSCFPIRMSVL